jgi:hypothetical protein
LADAFVSKSFCHSSLLQYLWGCHILRTDEARDIQFVRIEPDNIGQEFEHPFELLLLEVIAQAPVAEHLEERRVAVVADFFDILGAQTGLAVDQARALRGAVRRADTAISGCMPEPVKQSSRVVL